VLGRTGRRAVRGQPAAREGRTYVVLTMRADFYARCTQYPELAACIAAHQHLLGPMDEYAFQQAIEGPAQRTG
jgi:hypothetical protein